MVQLRPAAAHRSVFRFLAGIAVASGLSTVSSPVPGKKHSHIGDELAETTKHKGHNHIAVETHGHEGRHHHGKAAGKPHHSGGHASKHASAVDASGDNLRESTRGREGARHGGFPWEDTPIDPNNPWGILSPTNTEEPTPAPAAESATAADEAPVSDEDATADASIASEPVKDQAQSTAVLGMGGVESEFQCGSDNADKAGDCETCTMSSSCSCDGVVKFGYANKWTPWYDVSSLSSTGIVHCNTAGFGSDPYPDQGKVCMCRPKSFICATSVPPTDDCVGDLCQLTTTCHCNGEVRYGYGDRWTAPFSSKGAIQCGSKKMESVPDPIPTQDKVCQCFPSNLLHDPSEYDDLANSGVVCAMIAVILCYFVVYTWLACVRTRATLQGTRSQLGPSPFEQVLEAAGSSVAFFAPMLCAIFLGVTKRASTLTEELPWLYNLPAVWLRWAIAITATAFCLQATSYIAAEWSALRGLAAPTGDARLGGAPTVIAQTPAQARMVRFWRSFCNMCTVVMYIGVVSILVGIIVMQQPSSLVESIGRIPLHVGTICTIILACTYVLIYVFLHIYRTQEGAAAARGTPVFGLEVLKLAGVAVNFAPMLCILFLGTQIAVDWDGKELPSKVGTWMYVCTGSVVLQVLLVLSGPYLANADVQVVWPRGEVDFITRNHKVYLFLGTVRWIALFAMYVGIAIVLKTLWFTSVVPVMTHQLYRFAVLYFLAYLALWATISVRQLLEGGLQRAIGVLGMATETVVFCPMLSALLLASFVRAHAISMGPVTRGVPQGWVQDAMCVSAVALAIQLVAVCCAGACAPTKGANFQDGSPGIMKAFLSVFHIAMLVLWICVFLMILGVFMINRNNATGAGAIFA